jgi:hypothetical protein
MIKTTLLTALLCVAPAVMNAQFDFTVDGRQIQVHSFASQGFMYSNDNNYMTMPTSTGSFAFTDFGANISTQLTDKLRLGAQLYDRNIGQLGNWHPDLDWAVADYKLKDWFGIRAGKVKTTLGLYNDTQDMEFLQTWALMPQSMYSLDQRGTMISHMGGDIYGDVSLKKLGGIAYTIYGGELPQDPTGGWVYAMQTSSRIGFTADGLAIIAVGSIHTISSYAGPVYGADLRWTTPVKGLLVGESYVNQDRSADGTWNAIPFHFKTDKDDTYASYLDYAIGKLRFNAEYRRELFYAQQTSATSSTVFGAPTDKDMRMGYVSAAYRIAKMLEVGSYYSRFYNSWSILHSDPLNHVFDYAITARVDLRRYLDLKVEGHFMNGTAPGLTVTRGFYAVENPNGFKPDTRLLVIRLGYHL